jgi:hypothetical protein
MYRFTVTWYDVESGCNITREIMLDNAMIIDIALDQIQDTEIRKIVVTQNGRVTLESY